jgi:two-component system C4-dicarboxylate transport response regulator DctD
VPLIAPDVLVVDDDAASRMLTSQWLEDRGYQVEMRPGPREALEAMEECAPGVVVTNVHLPDHDGLWLAQQIQALLPDTALVFTSDDPSAGPVMARAGIGVFDYLERPFTIAQLVEAVERGTRWHALRVADRRQKAVADAEHAAPIWSYDAETETMTQHADWLPNPVAVSRLVTDLLLARSGSGGQQVS